MSTDSEKKAVLLANDRFSNPALPSIQEIRDAIPKECFEKNLPKSLAYMVWDFILLAFLYKIQPIFELAGITGMLFWYFLVGMVSLCVFIIGHDCGHTTFSNYTWLNDLVGHICHGMIFAPYWPWQKSHRQHHTYTGHLTKDHGHPWTTEKVYEEWSPARKCWNQYIGVPLACVGWWIYTIGGVADGSHFWPWSKLFKTTEDRVKCVISTLVCVAWATAAFYYFGSLGQWIKFYVIPCFAHSLWMITVTYLQHQTDDIQVYEDGTWGYVKGQLQTIDRPYGFGIDYIMHHITDGHVAHHLFFTGIPHYNLMKATAVIQAKLAPYGVYRHQKSHDFLYQLHTLTSRLQYLVGEGTGMLTYNKPAKKID